MAWIHNYDPNLDDLYLYSNPPKLYPSFELGFISGYNPNHFSKNQTIVVDGVEKTISLDFSGVENTGFTRYGDGGGYCNDGTCQNLPWPRCNAAWLYYKYGSQLLSAAACDPPNITTFELFGQIGINNTGWIPGKPLQFPANLINPFLEENAKYWENKNLWNHGSFTGHVLLENEDTTGETVYFITVGHPITTTPCASPLSFTFLDPDTDRQVTRRFVCPCVAWDLPIENPSIPNNPNDPYGLACRSCCGGENSILTGADKTGLDIWQGGGLGLFSFDPHAIRLWVMDPTEEPLPTSIKRYKVLVGPTRKDFPIYAIDPMFRVIKGIATKYIGRAGSAPKVDRFHHNVVISNESMNHFGAFNSKWNVILPDLFNRPKGQGDDGGFSNFTVTPTGETIWIDFGNAQQGTISAQDVLYNMPFESCVNGDPYYIDFNDVLQFNPDCAPAITFPERVIPNYPNNDVDLRVSLRYKGGFDLLNEYNKVLERLNKPKIVTYTFPEFILNPIDEINFPDISETTINYPLKNSPYFSRESKNTFFENANIIAFDSQKLLQASELNELQEKFYGKQKNLIEHINKWLNKNNINGSYSDALGFSEFANEKIEIQQYSTCSKTLPLNKSSITISGNPNGIFSILANKDWYMLNTNYTKSTLVNGEPVSSNIKFKNFDFMWLNEPIQGQIDINSLPNGETVILILNVDIETIVDCNQYSELKDNSNGVSTNAPCGARRNILGATNIKTYKLSDFNNLDTSSIYSGRENYPFNTLSWSNTIPHLLMFAKNENGIISFYYSNGVRIDGI